MFKCTEYNIFNYSGKMKKILIILFLIILISSVHAQTVVYSEKFYFDTTQEGNEISIPIKIHDVDNLYGFQLDLIYEESRLSYLNVTEGGFLSSDGSDVLDPRDLGIINTTSGEVHNIVFTRKTVETGVSGEGTLVNVIFTKLSNGITILSVSLLKLSDPNSTILDSDIYYLRIWDDTDTLSKEVGEEVTFYASLVNKSNDFVNQNCIITLDGNDYSMSIQGSQYQYTTSFNLDGEYAWSVTCGGFYMIQDSYNIEEASDEGGDDGGGSSGSGGSRGGSGISLFTPCESDWHCTDWQPFDCPSTGVQTRECVDQNDCSIPRVETQQCSYVPIEGELIETQEQEKEFCGNKRIDEGENSENCCKDVGCPTGYTCTALNNCVKSAQARVIKYTFWLFILSGIAVIAFIVITVNLTKSYIKTKKVKSRPDYRQYLTILKDFMLRAEKEGKSEKELEQDLEKIGWNKTYIKDAEKEIKKEKKFLDKVKK